ncbi:MerR family DNA-binding transcriptional regulator, partial [Clavibacter michiganensis]
MPTPPRRVRIGDAAAFVGVTPRTIRHYHQIGLLPEPRRLAPRHRDLDDRARARHLQLR